MEIEKKMDGNCAVLLINGKINAITSPELEDQLAELPMDVNEIVLDFDGVEYISSAGLRVLLATQEQMEGNGKLILRNINESVAEVLEVTGLLDVLTIE